MAQLTINIPDGIAAQVTNDLAEAWDYKTVLDNPNYDPMQPHSPSNDPLMPNPQSKAAFIKAYLINLMREAVKTKRYKDLEDQYVKTAKQDVNNTVNQID